MGALASFEVFMTARQGTSPASTSSETQTSIVCFWYTCLGHIFHICVYNAYFFDELGRGCLAATPGWRLHARLLDCRCVTLAGAKVLFRRYGRQGSCDPRRQQWAHIRKAWHIVKAYQFLMHEQNVFAGYGFVAGDIIRLLIFYTVDCATCIATWRISNFKKKCLPLTPFHLMFTASASSII